MIDKTWKAVRIAHSGCELAQAVIRDRHDRREDSRIRYPAVPGLALFPHRKGIGSRLTERSRL